MQQRQTKINNQKVIYKQTGHGEPVLILHGWGSSSTKWVSVARLLKNKGFQVIIPDLPGFGLSCEPQQPWSVSDYATFVQEFAKKLTLNNFILIGHSFGGRVAVKLSLQIPKQIKKTILVAPAGIKHKKTTRQKIASTLGKIGKGIPKFPGSQIFKKLIYRLSGSYDYFKASPMMKKVMQKVVAEDLTPSLEKIKVPVLLIWGKKDKITPLEDARLMHKKIPNAQLVIIPDAGHGIHLEKPKALAQIIANRADT